MARKVKKKATAKARAAKKTASTRKPAQKKATATSLDAPSSRPGNKTAKGAEPAQPKLLSGGNPQIPKGDGDAPVQAYIAAMPGWKSEAGRRIDRLIARALPGVRKAVKWNSPFYGVEAQRWFLSFHCFDKYIKVAFFRGAQLDPMPPVASKQKDVRYFHIHENDTLDEKQFDAWVKQASALPGEKM